LAFAELVFFDYYFFHIFIAVFSDFRRIRFSAEAGHIEIDTQIFSFRCARLHCRCCAADIAMYDARPPQEISASHGRFSQMSQLSRPGCLIDRPAE